MLFSIVCTDRQNGFETRLATRAQHLAHLEKHKNIIRFAGPMLDEEEKPCGSLIMIDVDNPSAADVFAAADPYTKAGLFESVIIRAVKTVFRDGNRVE
ncbi:MULTISPECIES: YciI family protein [Acetobacter]|uniref:YciI family protein n=1 Tax=Acetobacter thailandicus TaxID=1502842 RepID=A0ABT3QF23_9PROT|nr:MULTISPECIES: YciI family protein [Acetobacter]MBS0960029.1 YciI family protein [Acetobacter thailandicus]MBS0979358.1 YciI family protein [Acetobacter thailandicus]MBS0985562.1 YciI family protein [Acetobacter thailandicus]MBS1002477.1 YciI family protein [Acetobacter thailandicus]MCX2563892.1 YciI family protein [Acetobacter thailandicus]